MARKEKPFRPDENLSKEEFKALSKAVNVLCVYPNLESERENANKALLKVGCQLLKAGKELPLITSIKLVKEAEKEMIIQIGA